MYNYLKNSSKSQKFIDGKNYGCHVSAIHIDSAHILHIFSLTIKESIHYSV